MVESHKRDALWASPTHRFIEEVFFAADDFGVLYVDIDTEVLSCIKVA